MKRLRAFFFVSLIALGVASSAAWAMSYWAPFGIDFASEGGSPRPQAWINRKGTTSDYAWGKPYLRVGVSQGKFTVNKGVNRGFRFHSLQFRGFSLTYSFDERRSERRSAWGAPQAWWVTVPMWALMLLYFAYPFYRMVRVKTCRSRCQNDHGSCRSCGYDLTGNVSGKCPECGKRI